MVEERSTLIWPAMSTDPGKSVKLDPKTYALLKAQSDRLYRTLSGHIRALAEAEILRRDWRRSKHHAQD